MAYGIMLEMLLAEDASFAPQPIHFGGYLAEIERYALEIKHDHEVACYWARKYWLEGDPACEYLAMSRRSDPFQWRPPISAFTTETDKIKSLFLLRFQEKARAWGDGTLFGWPLPEQGVSARRPEF